MRTAHRSNLAGIIWKMRTLLRINRNKIAETERQLRQSQSHANTIQLRLDDVCKGRATHSYVEPKMRLCIDVDAKLARENPRVLEIAIEQLRRDASTKLRL